MSASVRFSTWGCYRQTPLYPLAGAGGQPGARGCPFCRLCECEPPSKLVLTRPSSQDWKLCRSRSSTGPYQALVHQVVPGGFGHVDVVVGGGAADVLEG